MEVNVLIVEDHPNQRKTLIKYLRKIDKVKGIYEASNATEMFLLLEAHKDINALILDIDLGPDSDNGLEAYSSLKEEYDIPAILLTGSQFDASLSYILGVIDVISKSLIFNFDRLTNAINKLCNYYRFKKFVDSDGTCVPICGDKNSVLFPQDISYIESLNGSVYVYTDYDIHPTTLRLNFYEDILVEHNFCLVHRSFLVNLNKVESCSNNSIYIRNTTIPISKDKIQRKVKKKNILGMITQFI